VGEINSSGRMVFSQENPLISPRRLSSNPNGDKTGPDHAPAGVFSGYTNDEFKIWPPNEPPSNRNSFCSQGSNNAESTSSNFSSSISQYLHAFRNSPPHSNMQSTLSINTDHNTAVKTPLSGDTDEQTATDIRNRNNSDANLHDGVAIAHFDYFFAEDGVDSLSARQTGFDSQGSYLFVQLEAESSEGIFDIEESYF
jgi:hypothetical protein